MKKSIISILALLAMTLTGCEENMTQEQRDNEMASRITEFDYKGHRYLYYQFSSGYQGYAGITHDPDCPCRGKGGSHD